MTKRAKRPTTKVVSALTARTQFGQIMKRAAENNERFLAGRRGEPSVVIMGVQDYIDTIAPPPEWLQKLWQAAQRNGTDALTPRQIDAEIRGARRKRAAKAEQPKR